eukprot:COSAG06_NODE_8409_length_2183_cov_1.951559_1_plen_323_part_00
MATLADVDAAACRGDLSVTHTALKLVNDDAHGSSEGSSDGAGGVYLWLYAVGVQLCLPYSLSYSDWVEAAEPFLPSPNRPSRTLQDDDKEEEDADASTVRGQHTASDDSSFYRNATISSKEKQTEWVGRLPLALAFRPDDPVSTLTEMRTTPGAEAAAGAGTDAAGAFSSSVEIAAGPDYGTADFWRTAPVLPNGWVLLGELDKFIGVSRQRITKLTTVTTAPARGSGVAGGGTAAVVAIQISLVGAAGEVVHLTAASHEGGGTKTGEGGGGGGFGGNQMQEASGFLNGSRASSGWKLCTMDVVIGGGGTGECVLPGSGSCK